MVVRFLTLILAACFRAFLSHLASLPLVAPVSEWLPIAPRWASEALAIFLAVVIVDTLWLLAEHAMRRQRAAREDEAGRDGPN